MAEPPMIVPNSMSPTGEILTNQGIWSVQFNKKVLIGYAQTAALLSCMVIRSS